MLSKYYLTPLSVGALDVKCVTRPQAGWLPRVLPLGLLLLPPSYLYPCTLFFFSPLHSHWKVISNSKALRNLSLAQILTFANLLSPFLKHRVSVSDSYLVHWRVGCLHHVFSF